MEVNRVVPSYSHTKSRSDELARHCNPIYSGNKDQEDHGSKPAPQTVLSRPYLEKNPFTKKGWWSGSMYRP
jgi:hypothetical protein